MDEVRWKSPPEGKYKLNTDVAKAGEFKWGVGAVIRDNEGEVLAAAVWTILIGPEVRVAEAAGMRLGLALARDLCFQRIVAESVSLELIQALEHEHNHPSSFNLVVDDCLHSKKNFLSCTAGH